jgi:hypothetical protein
VTVDLVATLTADEPADETVLALDDVTAFTDSDNVEVELDTGLKHATTLNGAPSVTTYPAGTVTLLVGLDTAASQYKKIRRVTCRTNARYFSVNSVDGWEIGDTLEAVRDNKSTQSFTVEQVLTSPCNILVIDADLTYPMSSGSEIKNQVGADITGFADFGTFPSSDPTIGDKTWGFRSTINHDHVGLWPGMLVRGEMIATDGTINAFQTARATVKRAT